MDGNKKIQYEDRDTRQRRSTSNTLHIGDKKHAPEKFSLLTWILRLLHRGVLRQLQRHLYTPNEAQHPQSFAQQQSIDQSDQNGMKKR